ncbi:hypothetical protein C8Q78DRAFT_988722 [Trametes maxima]|nr:hypothetical protein C8Q78DRAFT_988722 [Trametes maxima]
MLNLGSQMLLLYPNRALTRYRASGKRGIESREWQCSAQICTFTQLMVTYKRWSQSDGLGHGHVASSYYSGWPTLRRNILTYLMNQGPWGPDALFVCGVHESQQLAMFGKRVQMHSRPRQTYTFTADRHSKVVTAAKKPKSRFLLRWLGSCNNQYYMVNAIITIFFYNWEGGVAVSAYTQPLPEIRSIAVGSICLDDVLAESTDIVGGSKEEVEGEAVASTMSCVASAVDACTDGHISVTSQWMCGRILWRGGDVFGARTITIGELIQLSFGRLFWHLKRCTCPT